MGKKEDYVEKLATQLKLFGTRLDELKMRTENEAQEHKTRLLREISDLNAKRLDAQLNLRRLKETSGEVWETLVTGMDKAWGEMKDALHEVGEKFRQPR
ncbi:MAG: coiled coil domain-containing protein [Elusimicrobia bacterium CG_4_10_14_0_2_um_filter_56_8]|nr:MAG: coiled coil domain-containing protein [Elusimicrobia bacterium CG_4_10_14_0_2_um_filter_56_8]